MTNVTDRAAAPGRQPRRLLQRVLPTRYSALAAIQAFLLVGAIVYVAWPPPNETTTAFNVALVPALLLLMCFTETLARRLPWWGLETFLVLTWLLVAVLTATRSNGEGQIFLAFAIMALTVYALYYLPRDHAVPQVVGMVGAYVAALWVKFGNLGPSLLMLAFLGMLVGTALLGSTRANDRRERLLVEYAGDVVFHSSGGKIQWISDSVRDVLGWEPEDLIGTSINRLWHADDYEKALAIRDLAYSGTSGVGLLRFRTASGEYVWIEITFKPYSEHGETGAVGTMRDVSDRVAAEQALMSSEQEYRQLAEMEAEQRKQLAELDDVKTRLFQNISHELRTPLTLIQAPLQELLKDEAQMSAMSERRRADLEAAARAATGLQRLVDVLLDVARGQAGELTNSPEPTNLAALTRDSIAMFRSRAEQAGLQLIVTTVAFPPSVMIDRELWLKILTNLVSNAVKFTAEGQIAVDLRYARGTVELLVADSGSGISEEDLPNIFTRFQQASGQSARGESGSGIGLALVAELVRAASGNIHVDSVVGLGSTFIVRIPAERCEPADADSAIQELNANASPSAASPSVPAGEGNARLLLVEDHADLRTYVARLLNSQGWSVTPAATADEGRELIDGHDLVITDLMLPGNMSGIDLVRWMRQNPETASTTAIVLTARAGVGAFTEALDAGADAFLTKPFDPDALIARVSAHLSLDALISAEPGDPASQLRSNRTVRTAAAMIMATDGATAEAAFARLEELSELHKSAITDVAQDIVMSGRLASSR